MSAIPPFRQLQFNQVPGAPDWFMNFLGSLNYWLGSVYDITNAGTTFGDNIPRQLKTLTVIVAKDGTFPVPSFTCTLKAKPQAVLLAQCVLTAGTKAAAPISLNQWTYVQGKVQLDSIVGLQAGNTYNLTFMVL